AGPHQKPVGGRSGGLAQGDPRSRGARVMDVSFFGEMAWKSALISGFALALAYVLRSRAASDRALVLRLGVFMLLLLPVIALALPALRIEAWSAPPPPVAAPAPAAATVLPTGPGPGLYLAAP